MKADLHDEIMRIAAKPDQEWNGGEQHAYKLGHRDARHAAAELALAASGGNAASWWLQDKIIAYASSQEGRANMVISKAQFDNAAPKNRTEFDVPLGRIEAASAPNAALVAALKRISQPVGYSCGCHAPCRCGTPEAEAIAAQVMRDIADEALSALSAAGQEVGK